MASSKPSKPKWLTRASVGILYKELNADTLKSIDGFKNKFPFMSDHILNGGVPRTYFCAVDEHLNSVIAIAALSESKTVISIDFIEVSKDHRKLGIGKQLMERLFHRSADSGRTLNISGVTDAGEQAFTSHVQRLMQQHPDVKVVPSLSPLGR